MAELVAKQDRLQRSIERSLINFKKLGKNNVTAATVRSRIAALKDVWQQYQEGDFRLTETTPEEQKATTEYFSSERFEATEEVYQATLDYMANQLELLQPTVSPSSASVPAAARPSAAHLSLAHLPPIRLPPFDGNLDNWESFRDRFDTLILQNPDVTGFARMHFLISSVTGRASNCIANIPVTADNFDIAWDTLKKRFENKRRLVTSHLSVLLDLAPLPRESASDLQALRDRVNKTVSSLRNLGRTAEDLWNDILVHIISQKLDASTRKAWNISTSENDTPPTFSSLQQFLDSRVRALDDFASTAPNKLVVKPAASARVHVAMTSKDAVNACPLCKARHYLAACPSFLAKNVQQRCDLIKRQSRCLNCLSRSHAVSECSSKFSCRICQRRHHSLLHDNSATASPVPSPALDRNDISSRSACSSEINTHFAATESNAPSPGLLATAWVTVTVPSGRSICTRALIDQGSEASFISEALAQSLRAKRIRASSTISAIGGVLAGRVRHLTEISVSPRSSASPAVAATTLVLPSLSTYAPKRVSDPRGLSYLSELPWADPDPMSSHPINVILGSDVFPEVILSGLRKGGRGQPVAQRTIFGWVISGPLSFSSPETRVAVHHCIREESLERELRRFWEIEELPVRTVRLSPDEDQCESYFRETTARTADGRYVVRLPFRGKLPLAIGSSRPTAEKILTSLTRKLNARPSLAQEYTAFLREYEFLGHMQRVPESNSTQQRVYIPHHPVVREGSARRVSALCSTPPVLLLMARRSTTICCPDQNCKLIYLR